MGCNSSKGIHSSGVALIPKNLFEGEQYELKGEYNPGVKERLEGSKA
jgi:hypothetical protein